MRWKWVDLWWGWGNLLNRRFFSYCVYLLQLDVYNVDSKFSRVFELIIVYRERKVTKKSCFISILSSFFCLSRTMTVSKRGLGLKSARERSGGPTLEPQTGTTWTWLVNVVLRTLSEIGLEESEHYIATSTKGRCLGGVKRGTDI